MKRIALFCDGTWNDPSDAFATNALLLHESAAASDVQANLYVEGVGVKAYKWLGGAFGFGLNEIVLEAYRKLCRAYELGDEIYLFGFSRGAYTARSVSGMMRKCGIVRRDRLELVDKAMEIYREREDTADSPAAVSFRTAHAAAFYDKTMLGQPITPSNAWRMLRVKYQGIWDTVGELGAPAMIPFASALNKTFRFHDCNLSSFVEWGRHALAIDETRNAFEPTPWSRESIAEINDFYKERRVRQAWFPGDHGSVGGGGVHQELSSAALLWIAEGAVQAGLAFDDERGFLATARAKADPIYGPLRNMDADDFVFKLRGEGARLKGAPQTLTEVSEGALARMRQTDGYLAGDSKSAERRRKTLAAIMRTLGMLAPKPRPNIGISAPQT
jgi:uncharacterized protein (DUF2235 family)